MTFEYWTSGEFTDEAVRYLENKKSKLKKYDIDWKNGKDIIAYSKKINATSMVDALNQHYAKHPLS
jgi:hypothetical protein